MNGRLSTIVTTKLKEIFPKRKDQEDNTKIMQTDRLHTDNSPTKIKMENTPTKIKKEKIIIEEKLDKETLSTIPKFKTFRGKMKWMKKMTKRCRDKEDMEKNLIKNMEKQLDILFSSLFWQLYHFYW